MLKGIAKQSFIERIVHNLETRQIKKISPGCTHQFSCMPYFKNLSFCFLFLGFYQPFLQKGDHGLHISLNSHFLWHKLKAILGQLHCYFHQDYL